jgi:hypothetical protein
MTRSKRNENASGERSGRISVYRISQGDGTLALAGRTPVGRDANSVPLFPCA